MELLTALTIFVIASGCVVVGYLARMYSEKIRGAGNNETHIYYCESCGQDLKPMQHNLCELCEDYRMDTFEFYNKYKEVLTEDESIDFQVDIHDLLRDFFTWTQNYKGNATNDPKKMVNEYVEFVLKQHFKD